MTLFLQLGPTSSDQEPITREEICNKASDWSISSSPQPITKGAEPATQHINRPAEQLDHSEVNMIPAKRPRFDHAVYTIMEMDKIGDNHVYYVEFTQTGESVKQDLLQLLTEVTSSMTGHIRLSVVHPALRHEQYIQLHDANFISAEDIDYYLDHFEDTSNLVNITQAYHFEHVTSRHVKKYQATETWTQIKFDNRIIGKPISKIKDLLYKMFEQFIYRANKKYNKQDLVRLYISHPALPDDMGVEMVKLENLTPEHIMNAIDKLIQSNEGLPLAEKFTIQMGVLEIPHGGARVNISNYAQDRLGKRRPASLFGRGGRPAARGTPVRRPREAPPGLSFS